MTISEVDIKLLWGRAGGTCSKPDCTEDLTALVEAGNYVVGEMAHVIGRKPTARRSTPNGGPDTYDNLILLCPTHHTHIDKAPEGTFTAELLHDWKRRQEDLIQQAGSTQRFSAFSELRRGVAQLLASNRMVFELCGPRSATAQEDPESNLFTVWELRRLDRILPNNRKILNLIDHNSHLIPPEVFVVIEAFRVHADAYERHVYHRLDSYPLFPEEFEKVFSL